MRESISVRSSSSAALREQMVTFIDKMQENGAYTEAEIVERYMETAEQEGVTLAVEPFTKYTTHICNEASQLRRLLRTVTARALWA